MSSCGQTQTNLTMRTEISRFILPRVTTDYGHHSSQGSNAFNLKNVVRQEPIAHTLKQLPSFCSTNVRSLLPKVDELALLLSQNPVNVLAVTESWLNDDIDDDLVSISGYNLFRKDRSYRRGGGICVYLSQGIPVKRMIDLESHNFECAWLCLRPTRLPRPFSIIAVCVA